MHLNKNPYHKTIKKYLLCLFAICLSYMTFAQEQIKIMVLKVFRMDGRLVKRIQAEGPVHQLKGLMNGTYLVKITTDDGVIVNKVMKL